MNNWDHCALWTLTNCQMIYAQPKKKKCQVFRLLKTLLRNTIKTFENQTQSYLLPKKQAL